MKLLYILFFLGLFTSCSTTKVIEPKGYQSFKIIKIDTAKYKYNNIFYAKREGAIYKIVTKKEYIEPCRTVEKGKTYKLLIESTFPSMILNRLDFGGRGMYEKETIEFEGGNIIWDLFITSDIKGTCYIPEENKN